MSEYCSSLAELRGVEVAAATSEHVVVVQHHVGRDRDLVAGPQQHRRGGLLDFWAGTEKRAPAWMRKMKMEWLYRALSNPKKNLRKTLVSFQLIRFLIEK